MKQITLDIKRVFAVKPNNRNYISFNTCRHFVYSSILYEYILYELYLDWFNHENHFSKPYNTCYIYFHKWWVIRSMWFVVNMHKILYIVSMYTTGIYSDRFTILFYDMSFFSQGKSEIHWTIHRYTDTTDYSWSFFFVFILNENSYYYE